MKAYVVMEALDYDSTYLPIGVALSREAAQTLIDQTLAVVTQQIADTNAQYEEQYQNALAKWRERVANGTTLESAPFKHSEYNRREYDIEEFELTE